MILYHNQIQSFEVNVHASKSFMIWLLLNGGSLWK
jgi:hypothetical protein